MIIINGYIFTCFENSDHDIYACAELNVRERFAKDEDINYVVQYLTNCYGE
jgi:hypothetical protein